MISLTVRPLTIERSITVLSTSGPHIHIGSYPCDVSGHVGIDLDPFYFDSRTTSIQRVSLQPKKRGSDILKVVNERRGDDTRALVLVDIPPGEAGKTLWTATRGEGPVQDWARFPEEGITVVVDASGYSQGYEYPVKLIMMDPGSSFRIQRTGALANGEPEELFYAWVDGELRSGTAAEGVVPPPALPKPSKALCEDLAVVEEALGALSFPFGLALTEGETWGTPMINERAASADGSIIVGILVAPRSRNFQPSEKEAGRYADVALEVLLRPNDSADWPASFDPRKQWPSGLDEHRVRFVFGQALELLCQELQRRLELLKAATLAIAK